MASLLAGEEIRGSRKRLVANIVLVSGVIADDNASGGNWDCCTSGNNPDVKVDLSVAGATYVSDKVSSLTPQWDEFMVEGVLGSDIMAGLTLKLSDVDPGNDDDIGECEFLIDESSLGSEQLLDCPRDEANDQAGFAVLIRFE